MNQEELISKAMSELGKKSAAKRTPEEWKAIRLKGALARKKIKHEGATPEEEVSHKANYNCGMTNCPVKVEKPKPSQKGGTTTVKKKDMFFEL